MQFSILTGYGLLAIDYIAKNQDKNVTSQKISELYSIPLKSLENALQQLLRAGILIEVHGPMLGFALARPAKEISMLEIVEVIEGPISSEPCSNHISHENGLAEIRHTLEKIKLSDMIK